MKESNKNALIIFGASIGALVWRMFVLLLLLILLTPIMLFALFLSDGFPVPYTTHYDASQTYKITETCVQGPFFFGPETVEISLKRGVKDFSNSSCLN